MDTVEKMKGDPRVYVEYTVLSYLWDKFDEDSRDAVLHELNSGAGIWETLGLGLNLANYYKIPVPDKLLDLIKPSVQIDDCEVAHYYYKLRELNAELREKGQAVA